jgi:hypothetical protein
VLAAHILLAFQIVFFRHFQAPSRTGQTGGALLSFLPSIERHPTSMKVDDRNR